MKGSYRADRTCLIAPAVLHADIAVGAHMKPGLKTVLEGHRGHLEVVSQALKTEVANFFHTPNVGEFDEDL